MRTHADVCWRIDMYAQAESRALLAKDAQTHADAC